ncbi:MAG: sulfatase-like hydrolase/transferase [Pirellulaceae bacterium]
MPPFQIGSLLMLMLMALFLTGSASGAEPHARPNLILILADDLGYGDVSFHGSTEVNTPHLDRLASDGMLMTGMRANCTVCSPSRAAILTGIYADRAGVPGVIRTAPTDSWGFLKPGLPTLADRLKQVDYHTAIIGKWHLGLATPNTPLERGFDHFHGFLGDMMDDYYTHLRHGNNYMRHGEQVIEPEGHATELFTQWACDYLEQRVAKHDQPFFMYLAYNAPHFPIQPPQEWLQRAKQRHGDLSDKRVANIALVEHLDDQIGRLLQQVDALGLRDNTCIAFTSDNGGSLPHAQNNDPWRDGKQSHYDGGLRVPFVVRYPKMIAPGSRSDVVGLTFDLFPTFLQLAGADIPGDCDAVSLLNVLQGKTSTSSDRTMYFVRREGNQRYVGHAYHALIHGNWKLMQNDPFSPLELYHLEKDPYEQDNVIAEFPKITRELKQRLAEQIQVGGRVPWQPEHPLPERLSDR